MKLFLTVIATLCCNNFAQAMQAPRDIAGYGANTGRPHDSQQAHIPPSVMISNDQLRGKVDEFITNIQNVELAIDIRRQSVDNLAREAREQTTSPTDRASIMRFLIDITEPESYYSRKAREKGDTQYESIKDLSSMHFKTINQLIQRGLL